MSGFEFLAIPSCVIGRRRDEHRFVIWLVSDALQFGTRDSQGFDSIAEHLGFLNHNSAITILEVYILNAIRQIFQCRRNALNSLPNC